MPDRDSRSPNQRTGFAQDFRRYFLRGLAVFLPPILTIWILYELWGFLDQNVGKHANSIVRRYVVAPVLALSRSEPPSKDVDEWVRYADAGPWVQVAVDPATDRKWIQLPDRTRWVPFDVYEVVKSRTPENKAAAVQRVPGKVLDLYERYILYQYWEPYHLSFIGLVVAAVFIYFIGHFLATFIGNMVWRATEQGVLRLPIVRAVYPAVKQIIELLLSERKLEFNRVVAVQYPRLGVWSLGLVTGEGLAELEGKLSQDLLTVFVPYTPWSVTGYVITVPRREVLDLNVTVVEALQFMVSGGVIRPKPEGTSPPIGAAPGGAALAAPAPASPANPPGESSVPAPAARRNPIRVGTRGSQLARTQSEWVAARLRELSPGQTVELVEIKTGGDRAPDAKLTEIGGEGLFTKEIQRALLAGEVDVAVHSLKDLPTAPVDGLRLAAVPRRVAAFDVLISPEFGDWRALPTGSRIGTSSPRRRSQLLHLRRDLVIEEIRGNVPTRLRNIDDLGLAGVVLAHAGLHRLGLEQHITYRFTPDEMLPAPGQGALGIECRCDDGEIAQLLATLDDAASRHTTAAERAVLARVGAGCHVPLGAFATVIDDQLWIRAGIFALDGSRGAVESLIGPIAQAESLGHQLAERLLSSGVR